MIRTPVAAIVRERLRRDAAAVAAWTLLCGAAAFVQRFEDAPAHKAGALIFGVLCACVCASLVHARRNAELTLYERAAPLFGRQLARAHALYAAAGPTAGLCVYWTVSALYGSIDVPAVAVSVLCAYAAAAIVLEAHAGGRASKIAAAILTGALPALSFWLAPLYAAACCAAAGYIALRQYGETLARR